MQNYNMYKEYDRRTGGKYKRASVKNTSLIQNHAILNSNTNI